jgi:hypothetical protein
MNITDDQKKILTGVTVGVGATAAIATAMYFLGGREAPTLPSLDSWKSAASRELGLEGAIFTRDGDDNLYLFTEEHEASEFARSLRGEGVAASRPFQHEHEQVLTALGLDKPVKRWLWAVRAPRTC